MAPAFVCAFTLAPRSSSARTASICPLNAAKEGVEGVGEMEEMGGRYIFGDKGERWGRLCVIKSQIRGEWRRERGGGRGGWGRDDEKDGRRDSLSFKDKIGAVYV